MKPKNLQPNHDTLLSVDSRLWNCFVACAQTHSFQRAGNRLGKSKATISRWINELEDILGYRLFDRESSGQSIQINARGSALLPKVQLVLNAHHRLETHAFALNQPESPACLTLMFNQLVDNDGIAHVLSSLYRHYPHLEISVSRNDEQEQISALLQNKQADFVLGLMPDAVYPEIGGLVVGTEQVVLVAHPKHSTSDYSILDSTHLLSERLIYPKYLMPGNKLKKHSFALDTINTPDFQLALELTKQGLGVAYLPEHVARQAVLNKEVVALDLNWEEFSQQLSLMMFYRLDYPFPDITQTLVDGLRNWFGYQP
jgi:DNA-binding transcriptional LysR family regulator